MPRNQVNVTRADDAWQILSAIIVPVVVGITVWQLLYRRTGVSYASSIGLGIGIVALFTSFVTLAIPTLDIERRLKKLQKQHNVPQRSMREIATQWGIARDPLPANYTPPPLEDDISSDEEQMPLTNEMTPRKAILHYEHHAKSAFNLQIFGLSVGAVIALVVAIILYGTSDVHNNVTLYISIALAIVVFAVTVWRWAPRMRYIFYTYFGPKRRWPKDMWLRALETSQ